MSIERRREAAALDEPGSKWYPTGKQTSSMQVAIRERSLYS